MREMAVCQLNWIDRRSISTADIMLSDKAKITYSIVRGRLGRQKSETYVCTIIAAGEQDVISDINFSLKVAKETCQRHFEGLITAAIGREETT